MADEHDEVLACALGHAYLCLALVFSGRHAEAAAGAVAAERLQAIDHFSGLVSLDIHLGYLHLLSGELDAAIERCDQGLRRLGAADGQGQERWASGYLQIITALALFFQNKYTESAAAACASLEKHELGDIVGAAYCLEALAMLSLRQQRCERRPGSWGRRTSCGSGPASGSAAPPSWRNFTSRRSRRRRTRSTRTATRRCSAMAPAARSTSWSRSR